MNKKLAINLIKYLAAIGVAVVVPKILTTVVLNTVIDSDSRFFIPYFGGAAVMLIIDILLRDTLKEGDKEESTK